jgi:hypothetical protein
MGTRIQRFPQAPLLELTGLLALVPATNNGLSDFVAAKAKSGSPLGLQPLRLASEGAVQGWNSESPLLVGSDQNLQIARTACKERIDS